MIWLVALLLADPVDVPLVGGTARFSGEIYSRFSLDTSFSHDGEDVFEWHNRAQLKLDYHRGDTLRVFIGTRADAWVEGGAPANATFDFANASNVRADYFVEVREAFVDIYTRHVDFRLGNQIFTWGQNEGLAPADALNPIDARDIIAGDPALLKVPVLAAQATIALGDKASLRLVWEPFFVPNQVNIFGQDFSALTPGSVYAKQLSGLTSLVDPSLQTRVQEALVGTKIPNASPVNSTAAARVQGSLGPLDVALSGIFGWNKTPDLYVDPSLAELTGVSLQNVFNSPQALSVLSKLQSGATLLDAHYSRTGTIAVDAALAEGDFTIKLDAGVSPNTVVYTDSLETLHRTQIRTVLGVEYHYGDDFQADVAGYVNNIANLGPGERLLFLDPANIADSKTRVSTLAGVMAFARWLLWEERIALSAAGAWNGTLGDIAGVFRATYNFNDFHHVSLGVLLMQGQPTTPFGYFAGNDEAWLEYRFVF